jgi:hypothetical protein
MACNRLHLTEQELIQAPTRIFRFNPKRVFLVSEFYPGIEALPEREDYTLRLFEYYETESSFAYHHIGEVLDHLTSKKNGNLSKRE